MLLRALSLFLLSAVTIWLCINSPQPEVGDHKGVIMNLPTHVLNYTSKRDKVGDAEREILPPDTEFEKRTYYSNTEGSWLNCTIVLAGQDRTSIHRPEICLKAQGWDLIGGESGVRHINLQNGQSLDVMDLALERLHEDDQGKLRKIKAHYYFWFVGKDKTTPFHTTRILTTAFDNIFRSVNHRWAYVSVMMFVENSFRPTGLDDDQTQERIRSFIAEAAPEFQTTLIPLLCNHE